MYENILKSNSKKKLKKFIDDVQIPSNLGCPNRYISTDFSISYIYSILNEAGAEVKFLTTSSITYLSYIKKGVHCVDNRSMENNALLLFRTYKEIITKNNCLEGIYSVINVTDIEEGGVGHQNWIYIDFVGHKIIRFEPFGNCLNKEYKLEEFILIIKNNLEKLTQVNWKWEYFISESIFYDFAGCRIVSTLFAYIHIKKINKNCLLNLFYGPCHIFLLPFVLKMQFEIYNKFKFINFDGQRKSRRINKNLLISYK